MVWKVPNAVYDLHRTEMVCLSSSVGKVHNVVFWDIDIAAALKQ